ncbi:hypothetical protein RRG08_062719 [Elysia crispata]|uniref:Uncharacterized protein n=1 Tax=Elysia crispata TaxID=231223 RepID=A0AAE1ABR8_9GAST|nr:hypothetical protein RRG08_062719 [Elysia crispata]
MVNVEVFCSIPKSQSSFNEMVSIWLEDLGSCLTRIMQSRRPRSICPEPWGDAVHCILTTDTEVMPVICQHPGGARCLGAGRCFMHTGAGLANLAAASSKL